MTSKEVKKNFGKKLQKLRDNKHLTQEELSEILECSPEAVRHWEQGRILPTPKNLFKICDFFNCDVAYLFAIIEEKTYELKDLKDRTGLSVEALQLIIEERNRIKGIDDFVSEALASLEKESNLDELNRNLQTEIPESENLGHEDITPNYEEKPFVYSRPTDELFTDSDIFDSDYLDGLSLLAKMKDLVIALHNYLRWNREIHDIRITSDRETVDKLLSRPDETTKEELSVSERVFCIYNDIDLSECDWKEKAFRSSNILMRSDDPITEIYFNGRPLSDNIDLMEHTLLENVILNLKMSRLSISNKEKP